jgi:hypothetical protein
VKPESGGGLLLLRHVTPLTRRHVAYFCSGAHTGEMLHAFQNHAAIGRPEIEGVSRNLSGRSRTAKLLPNTFRMWTSA